MSPMNKRYEREYPNVKEKLPYNNSNPFKYNIHLVKNNIFKTSDRVSYWVFNALKFAWIFGSKLGNRLNKILMLYRLHWRRRLLPFEIHILSRAKTKVDTFDQIESYGLYVCVNVHWILIFVDNRCAGKYQRNSTYYHRLD